LGKATAVADLRLEHNTTYDNNKLITIIITIIINIIITSSQTQRTNNTRNNVVARVVVAVVGALDPKMLVNSVGMDVPPGPLLAIDMYLNIRWQGITIIYQTCDQYRRERREERKGNIYIYINKNKNGN
jgi:hypothetical protein